MSVAVHLEDVTEDLAGILVDVLSSVLSEEAAPTGETLTGGPLAVARLGIHDQLTDEYTMVEVRLCTSLAKSIAARMLSVASPDPDDVVDAVAEIANIAGGNVKTLLCQHARLSLPTSRIVGSESDLDDLGTVRGAAQVRAVMVGQIAQLAVIPGADPAGLLWPPSEIDPDPEFDHDDPGRLL